MMTGTHANAYQAANRASFIHPIAKDAVQPASGSTAPISQAVTEPAGQKLSPGSAVRNAEDERMLKKLGILECSTCSSRKYVDGSDDPGVSFKTPAHVAPETSNSAVAAHEQEHVSRERSKASAEGRKVVSQSVQIYMDTCPECGKVYASGGKTTTMTKSAGKPTDFFTDQMKKFFEKHFGKEIDFRV
jgi:Zn-finger nucleic acid-binding protein